MDILHVAEDKSFFYNGNIDSDYNCLNSYTANYTMHYSNLSIMYINPKICLSYILTAEV